MSRLIVCALTLLSSLCVVYGKGSSHPIPLAKNGDQCGQPTVTAGRGNGRGHYITPGWQNGRYSNNINCSTILMLHSTNDEQYMRIKVVQMRLQTGRGCNNDYIMIYDNHSGKMMGKLCGSDAANSFITVPSDQARVVFVTDGQISSRGAKLRFWRVGRSTPIGVFCGGSGLSSGHCVQCGGTLTGSSGSLQSPFYGQDDYPNNMDCEWTIDTESEQFLRLTFDGLALEEHEMCHYDHLRVYSSLSDSPLVTFCGEACSPEVIVPADSARVTFTSDFSVTSAGFKMNYELVNSSYTPGTICNCDSGCLGESVIMWDSTTTSAPTTTTVPTTTTTSASSGGDGCNSNFTSLFGVITSPNYPQLYPNYARCRNTITLPEGLHVRLIFNHFQLEEHDTCNWDSFAIYLGGGSQAYQTLCGSHSGTMDLPSNQVLLVFESDSSLTFSGYNISYAAINHDTTDDEVDEGANCGGILDGTSGVIQSPNYPDNYPDNVECEWQITVPSDKVIQLEVVHFSLESHSSCRYDKLTVIDLFSTTHYCGETFDFVRSSVYMLTLRFTTDVNTVSSGFHILYEAVDAPTGGGDGGDSEEDGENGSEEDNGIDGGTGGDRGSSACGGTLTSSRGEILSPHYPDNYPNGAQCEWYIEVDEDQVIQLQAEEWSIENHPTCNYDKVIIFDATTRRSYCNSFSGYTSTGNSLYVIFESDSSITRAGFKLTYQAVEPEDEPDNGGDGSNGNGGNGNGGGNPSGVTCGPVYSAARIVGGNDADENEYPWMALLRYGGTFTCGGTIISDRWVLTAAHCVYGRILSFSVMVGGHHYTDNDNVISVSQVHLHPSYDHASLVADIALLELSRPVTWSDLVAPACLSSQDPAVGLDCVITGWGDTEAAFDPHLQEADVPILSDADCRMSYGDSFLDHMMCAGSFQGGVDTCQGDSGGPLVCKINNAFVLHGVTSWGYGCADRQFPGIYTRVARYIDWIHTVTDSILA